MSEVTGNEGADESMEDIGSATDQRQESEREFGGGDGGGQVSETGGLGGSAPTTGADAVPSEHTTPGQSETNV